MQDLQGTSYCCRAWEHPEAHQHEGVQTGSVLLLFGCVLLLDGHWWDLPLLSSLVSLRTNLLVHGDLMEVQFPHVILLKISSSRVSSLF